MSGLINSAGSKSGVIGTTELDYEEGTWTATVTPNGGTVTTLNSSDGTYTKIGNLVALQLVIDIGDKGSASGGMNLSNLPFVTANDTPAVAHNASTGANESGGYHSTNGNLYTYVTWANHQFMFQLNYRI